MMMEGAETIPADEVESFPTILCCICGIEIQQNPCNMCVSCLKDKVDITEDIHKQLTIHSCNNCGRWLCPPWQTLQLESKELMATCLRKIHGLSKVKLIDASWIWTEPHSQRLKIKITIQKEVMNGAVLQQATIIEYTIRNQQCVRCQANFACGAWHAIVQVRQRATHKRTFFFLEQLLIRYNAHAEAVNIVTFRDGMDFYFPDKQHGVKFVDFLSNHVPCKTKYARKLVSADHKENTGNFKHNHYVELAPVCKDDLVILPKDVAMHFSNIARLVLIRNVAAEIHMYDPFTCEKRDVSAEKYWKSPFNAIMNSRQMIRFVVLSVELQPMSAANGISAPSSAHASNASVASMSTVGTVRSRPSAKIRGGFDKKMRLAEVVIAREKDFGVNDTQFTVLTHLGNVLKEGDIALGYDLATAHWAQEGELVELLGHKHKEHVPDVILVRKHYPTKGERKWQLRQLEVNERHTTTGYNSNTNAAGNLNAAGRKEEENAAAEYEEFLQEVEADREMRKHINLYKKPKAVARFKGEKKGKAVLGAAEDVVKRPKKAGSSSSSSAAGGKMEGADGEDDEDEWEDVDDEDDEDEDADQDDENMVRLDELLDDLVVSANVDEGMAGMGKGEMKVLTAEEAKKAVDIYATTTAVADSFRAEAGDEVGGSSSSSSSSSSGGGATIDSSTVFTMPAAATATAAATTSKPFDPKQYSDVQYKF